MTEPTEKCFETFGLFHSTFAGNKAQGLKLRDTDDLLKAIFHAVFNDQINLKADTLGDEYYKYDDWIKEGFVDEGGHCVAYPPAAP